MQWVDPLAIELYQRYINYLEDVVRLVKTIDLWGAYGVQNKHQL
jgi:hypothetical protein